MRILIKKSSFTPIVKDGRGVTIQYDMLPAIPAGAIPSEPEEKVTVAVQTLPPFTTFEAIKATIIKDVKARISAKILGGFQYDDEHYVTLSDYDQANFSRLYAMAGLPFLYPLTINIGRSEDQHTITFADKAEFDTFMSAVNSFIEGTRAEGRATLAAINWEIYKL